MYLKHSQIELRLTNVFNSDGTKEVPQQSSIRNIQTLNKTNHQPPEKTIPSPGRIHLLRQKRRNHRLIILVVNPTPFFAASHHHTAQTPHLFDVHEQSFVRGSFQEPDPIHEVMKPALFQIHELHGSSVDGIENSDQSLYVYGHHVADLHHLLERLRENLPSDADGHPDGVPRVGDVGREDRIACGDAFQDPIGCEIEVGFEDGGLVGRRHDRGVGDVVVFEVAADFGDQMAGDGGRVEDVGDEGGGAAEGFGHDGAVLDENVVAVVSDDEDSGRWVGCLLLRRGRRSQSHDVRVGERIM